MNTREFTKNYRASQWLEVIKDRQNSGLSVKDYCQKMDLSKTQYYYWQKKIREAACESIVGDNKTSAIIPNGWAKLISTNSADETLKINIAGCQIEVDSNTDLELLKRVCYLLRD